MIKDRGLLTCLSENQQAELAQSVERTTLNRVVVGSIPTFGVMMVMVASKVNKEYGSRNVN